MAPCMIFIIYFLLYNCATKREGYNVSAKLTNVTQNIYVKALELTNNGTNSKLVNRLQYLPFFNSVTFPLPTNMPMLNRKIFRGLRVSIIEHPYIVSIRRNYAHYLSGVILAKNVIVTVAHPLLDVPTTELAVVAGENYADRGTAAMTVLVVIIHERFDRFRLTADLALLRLFEDLVYRVNIKPIFGIFSQKIVFSGRRKAFVTAWGRCDMTGRELCFPRSSQYYPDEMLDPMLRSISFPMRETSQNRFCDYYIRYESVIRPGTVCTGPAREQDPVAPCLGVPGAALVLGGRLLGLQSWGFGCGYTHDLPLVYTDLRYYSNWIHYNVQVLSELSKDNVTQLFDATKASLINEWLEKTRSVIPIKHTHVDDELQPLEIDKHLARLRGNIYDLRNFMDGGKYHESKKKLYSLIRAVLNRSEKLREVQKSLENRVNEPFIRYKSEDFESSTENAGIDAVGRHPGSARGTDKPVARRGNESAYDDDYEIVVDSGDTGSTE